MAKINKYWGYVAIGALTAAAAGAVAALIAKKGSCKEDFDFEEEPAEDFQSWEHTGEQSATDDTENEEAADTDDSEKSSDKAAEVEIKDAEEEEDADEPENFEETMDAAAESEE